MTDNWAVGTFLFVGAFLASCTTTDKPEVPAVEERRSLSLSTVEVYGLRVGLSRGEVESVIGKLRCNREERRTIAQCTYTPDYDERKRRFPGVYSFGVEFDRDKLSRIEITYVQILDIEYPALEESIRSKYPHPRAETAIDTTSIRWDYDSLRIVLTPNRRRHWTRGVYTYTPVLEIGKYVPP